MRVLYVVARESVDFIRRFGITHLIDFLCHATPYCIEFVTDKLAKVDYTRMLIQEINIC